MGPPTNWICGWAAGSLVLYLCSITGLTASGVVFDYSCWSQHHMSFPPWWSSKLLHLRSFSEMHFVFFSFTQAVFWGGMFSSCLVTNRWSCHLSTTVTEALIYLIRQSPSCSDCESRREGGYLDDIEALSLRILYSSQGYTKHAQMRRIPAFCQMQ